MANKTFNICSGALRFGVLGKPITKLRCLDFGMKLNSDVATDGECLYGLVIAGHNLSVWR